MSIPSFSTINDPKIQDALAEVAELEVGAILNDHYSADFYTERRARFLGRHPNFAGLKNGLFAITCEDADVVFGDYRDDLSVQEVRRREISNGILPFLPLPTTQSTQTLSDFAGLPDSEWQEGKPGVWPTMTPSPPPPPASARLARDLHGMQTKNSMNAASGARHGQSSQQAEDDEVLPPQRRNEKVRFGQRTAMEGGSAAQQLIGADDANFISRIVGELDRLYPSNNGIANTEAQNAPTNASYASPSTKARATPALANIRGNKASSGAPGGSALSYANRPTNTRVKVKRSTKRHTGIDGQDIEYVSTDSEAGSDSVASADEASLGRPRPKMVKLNAGPYPKGVKTSAAKPVDSRASSTAPYTTGRKKFVPDTRPKKTVASSGSEKKASGPTIAAIVSGAALPRTRAQAQEADEERYALLVSAHNESLRARKKGRQEEPELMPEYFQTALFPAASKTDQVRCVCGVVTDDGANMVCCDADECNVWQHIACVGEAAPKDLQIGGYRCHNCDSWLHRRVIQGLRRANVVEAIA